MSSEEIPQKVHELLDQAGIARKEHRLDDAYRCLAEAVALCRQTGLRRELVSSLGKLGHIELDARRYDAAREAYEESVSICREIGDTRMLAHAIRHLGDVYRHGKWLPEAEACYTESLALYRDYDQTHQIDLANAIRPMALLKEATGRPEEAIQLWKEASELYNAFNLMEGVDECIEHLAKLGSP